MGVDQIKRDYLLVAAQELNKFLSPPIKTDGNNESIKKQLVEGAQLVQKGDELTEQTIKVLADLGCADQLVAAGLLDESAAKEISKGRKIPNRLPEQEKDEETQSEEPAANGTDSTKEDEKYEVETVEDYTAPDKTEPAKIENLDVDKLARALKRRGFMVAKPRKPRDLNTDSPYNAALDYSCRNPEVEIFDLFKKMHELGYAEGDKSSIRTAHSNARRTIRKLREIGWSPPPEETDTEKTDTDK